MWLWIVPLADPIKLQGVPEDFHDAHPVDGANASFDGLDLVLAVLSAQQGLGGFRVNRQQACKPSHLMIERFMVAHNRPMSNKTYGQLCPLARSLDVLGERWTMLVIRELLLGPKRFKDLLAKLPAMGTNRLSERLSSLTTDGVVRKSLLSATATVPVYELTEHGEQLRDPLIALSLWGLKLSIDERIDATSARAELIALSLAGAVSPLACAGVHETYEFQVGNEKFHFSVDGKRVLPRSGPSPVPPDVSVVCDLGTFMALALGEIKPEQVVGEHRAALLKGTIEQFVGAFRLLAYTPK